MFIKRPSSASFEHPNFQVDILTELLPSGIMSNQSQDTEKGTIPATDRSQSESNSVVDENHHEKSYSSTKTLTLRKAEIQAEQYRGNVFYTIALLFSAFLIGYGYSLDASIRYVYTAYAASDYGHHSLISTIGVINAVIGAAAQVVYARLSDVFGRLQLLITAIVFYVIGTIIQSQAYDIQRYCAGAVFYNLGYVGVLLVVLLILSDASTLRWRLFYQFVPTLPFIINTWISGNITEAVGPSEHWSWGIGMWAFIFPLSSLPFIGCILHMRYLAGKSEAWSEVKTQKTFFQTFSLGRSLIELAKRTDIIGVFLLTVGLGCLLVPLTLAAGVADKWRSGKIIAPLVIGFAVLPLFVFYESKFAEYPLAPFKLLKDRGVWAALVISFFINFIFYMAYDYLYTVLIVAMRQSTKSATRITSVNTFVSTVWAPFFSIIVAYTRRLKPFIIFGVSSWFLAVGLLYHFRGGENSKDGVIGALVVWGFGSTFFTYPNTVSVQSVTSHENMATVTALCYVVYRIGSAVGNAVSGAVWTQLLPSKLETKLGNATLAASVYADPYTFAATYAWNSTERKAVVQSYRYIQRMETIIALCFCVCLFGVAFFLRDARLTDETAHEDLKEGELIYTKGEDKIYDFITGIFRKKKRTSPTEEKKSVDPLQ